MLITEENFRDYYPGSKACRLFELKEFGFLVPDFVVTDGADTDEEILAYLKERFGEGGFFSVRSSASVEDSGANSFAGQFRTFLHVPFEEVPEAVRKVLAVEEDENVVHYCKEQGISASDIKMHVIVQKMIPAVKSGVLFTANPMGLLNETVIVLGEGCGNNVVEDKVDTTTYYFHEADDVYYYDKQKDAPVLSEDELHELVHIGAQAKEKFGFYCDMEYAIADGKIYVLQVRPITTLPIEEETIVLDNSNIVESYPGITLPLTQSFVRQVYYKVFRRLLLRLTRDKRTVEGMDDILQHMVDVANGRVYYRISNWYDVILLLPFHKKIIPVWQEMLGVRQKTVTCHNEGNVSGIARVRTFFSFVGLLCTTPRKMKDLERYFEEVLEYFGEMDVENASNRELLAYYRDLENRVTDRWDITLANDMYSFLFTALVKARLKAKADTKENVDELANRYISQIADIESMKPIRELAKLSKRACEEGRLEELRQLSCNDEVLVYFTKEGNSFGKALSEYVKCYGDRNVEELKLESKTFRTDPVLLVQKVLQYAENEFVLSEPKQLEMPAKGLTGWLAKRAAVGIQNRESSRMNRGRLYGIMRGLMLRVGENLKRVGMLEQREDVFYIFLEELDEAVGQNRYDHFKELVCKRKVEYAYYQDLPAYSRLLFAGKVWSKPLATAVSDQQLSGVGCYNGVPCSGGVAEGEVLVVKEPSVLANSDVRGKILVTKMTDPGWVFFIAAASGVVAEKGSLLSHTAIISRELGKPAVVGIPKITGYLKDGQRIRVNGDTGEVTVLENE